MNTELETAFNQYFKNKPSETENKVEISLGGNPTPKKQVSNLRANGNISTVDGFGELLRRIINASWGSDWGLFGPEFKKGENPEKTQLPQIIYSLNNREIADGHGIKPTLFEESREIINGVPTGQAISEYRQFFDCIIEINTYARTAYDIGILSDRVETLISYFTGYIKEQGVSELFFLKEQPPEMSLKFIEGIPMKSLLYYIKLEKVQREYVDTLTKVKANLMSNETLNQLPKTNIPNSIFDNINIKYNFEEDK